MKKEKQESREGNNYRYIKKSKGGKQALKIKQKYTESKSEHLERRKKISAEERKYG